MTSGITTRMARAALAVLAAGACIQLWQVGDRVLQLAWLSFKFSHLESIMAGRSAFIFFIALSVAGAAGASLLARSDSGLFWRRAAWVVSGSYLAVAALWSVLIMSPLVEFARW